MPESNYDQVMAEIKTLRLSDQLRLLEEMAALIRKETCQVSQVKPRSILELKGKGKEIWKGVNVKSYLNEERSSWNG
jgi:hypothetical protein